MDWQNKHLTESKSGVFIQRQHYIFGLVGIFLLVVGFLFGFSVNKSVNESSGFPDNTNQVINKNSKPSTSLDKEIDFARFWEVWNIVKERYVKQPVSDADLFYGAVAGLVGSLEDPYSVFLDPEIATLFESELSGTFQGIGAEIGIKDEQLKIIAPLPNTPADQAGLRSGDSILAIDGVDTFGLPIDEAVSRIRGEGGTEVVLRIAREGEDDRDYSITRDTIVVDSMSWRMENFSGKQIGVIELYHFNETTSPAFEEAIQNILLQDPDGLILDLRNNPGGFLDTAVEIAGEWVPHDVIVQEKFSDGSVRNYNSNGVARLADIPTVVLVNGGSASASEIVAGSLQQHRKATIVGEQTFGKGSVQDYLEFEDGSALKLTIALWLMPDGRSIDQSGVTPDVVVELTQEDFDAERDPQLDRALEILTTHTETEG